MTPAFILTASRGTASRSSLPLARQVLRPDGHRSRPAIDLSPASLLLVLFFSLISPGGFGQTPSAQGVAASKSDFPQEAFVIQSVRTTARFENDGSGTRATSAEVRVQSEAGVQQWGLLTFGYSSDFEQPEITYVRVRKAGGTLVETPAENIQDVTSDVSRVAPMYTDYHEKHVAVKGLGIGDVLEYEFISRTRAPLVPGQFWFAYDFGKTNITLDEEVEIDVPKDREIKLKSADLKPEVREEGNRRIYTWKSSHRESAEDEEPRRIIPPPQILLSTFKSWEEVGQWWNGLEKERVAITPEIRAKAGELTRNAATRDEKARAIYNYVATSFRYIGISLGIGRYQPHAAAEVLSNEYGDCKDKHTLLASLLSAAGIDAYPALMNAVRQIDPEVPSPGQFDHVVTALPDPAQGGKMVWLDTTTEVAPFGLLTFNLRDKRALVIPSTGQPHLETTPADPPFKSFQHFQIDATLRHDCVLEGKVRRDFRGDYEVLVRAAFRQVAQAQWKDLAQRLSQATGFAGDVSDVEVGAPGSTSEPFSFSYKYTRKDYSDCSNHRIQPPVGALSFLELEADEKRTQPLFLGAPIETTAIARVELPKGYKVTLPLSADIVRDFAEYHSTYTFKDGIFVASVRETIKKCEVPVVALDEYRSFQKAVLDDLSRFTDISYSNESSSVAASPPPLSSPTSPPPAPSPREQARTLVLKAHEALQRNDLNEATELMARAVQTYDRDKGAWMTLAELLLRQGRSNDGIKAIRQAIELDPTDTRLYRRLGTAYMSLGRPEDALQVWRDVLKQAPNDDVAHASLGQTLLGLKRYAEAIPELETAAARDTSSTSLQILLAQAYVGAGNTDKAMTIYMRAAESATNPWAWNEAAYALADHHASLPDAQRYAEKAVRSVEDDANHVKLADLTGSDLNRMEQLASFWDTLGWVYFQENQFDKAQRYLEASWNLDQKQSIAEHLAQIYAKQGKKAESEHLLALAHALTDEEPPALRHHDGTPQQMSPLEELSELRRTKLGNLSSQVGSAEFFVLLAPGGQVEDLKFVNGDDDLRSLGKALALVKFMAAPSDEPPVKLVRRGELVCATSGCEFTLFPVEVVRSTD